MATDARERLRAALERFDEWNALPSKDLLDREFGEWTARKDAIVRAARALLAEPPPAGDAALLRELIDETERMFRDAPIGWMRRYAAELLARAATPAAAEPAPALSRDMLRDTLVRMRDAVAEPEPARDAWQPIVEAALAAPQGDPAPADACCIARALEELEGLRFDLGAPDVDAYRIVSRRIELLRRYPAPPAAASSDHLPDAGKKVDAPAQLSSQGVQMTDFEIGAWAMVLWIYNTSGIKFAETVFPGAHETYLEEKAELWARSPTRALGMLDNEHLQRVFAAVRAEEQAARQTLR